MPSSNRSRSNSILEQLPIIPQTSRRLTHFTIPTLSIIAQARQSHPSASNLLRKLLIHTHRKQSLIIRALMLQAPVRNVPLDSITHKWSNNQTVLREWTVVHRSEWLNPPVTIYSQAEYRRVSAARSAKLSRPHAAAVVLWGQEWIHTKLCVADRLREAP